jgi:hypothetical protein
VFEYLQRHPLAQIYGVCFTNLVFRWLYGGAMGYYRCISVPVASESDEDSGIVGNHP